MNAITSLPIMMMEGIIKSHGACANAATLTGLVHNKINVAATISCNQFQY